ncbi:Hsp33 family molecular chaperone HslO [Sphingomonas solaris]|uniref:Hsp33 family molecular chaperone HslO n=1 Tax=Alterirhizorhabdus solaris TaxID=2529389 RepID=A0A558R6M3_9SPHN|nr:Hsp33 family molecular chaperone HslO [Sphingomonas solaris]TVV75035.1 Hsp33 family molecular chaperone HslO [Sphingomonas solaris]
MSVSGTIDTVLGFTIPSRHARGRLVRLGPVLDSILAAHDYPPAIGQLLAEALTLTALLGSTLKHKEGQLTVQAQTEGGVVDLLVCDYRGGEMRGYVRHDPVRLAEMPVTPSLFALFGKGYLAITFDQAVSGERYQGIVPLEGGSLAEAAESYFSQSEQIPSLVRLASVAKGPEGHIAGGLMLQHLPEGEEGRERLHTRLDHPEWEQVHALASTITPGELTDSSLKLEQIAWRLFNEADEVRVLPGVSLSRGCRCNPVHTRDVIARFPADEQRAMADEDGLIHVDCEFCSRRFSIALADILVE